MNPAGAASFAKLVAAYNEKHPDMAFSWKNYPSEAALASDGAARGWVVVSAATGRRLKQRQGFTGSVSPKVLAGLIKGFAVPHAVAADDSLMPLLGTAPLFIVDVPSVDAGVGGVPPRIGALLDAAAAHRRKRGHFLYAPAFGDANHLLRFLHSQGAQLTGPRGDAVFPAGEVGTLLSPWVKAYRQGDLPVESLAWDEAQAARAMIMGKADMVLGGHVAVDVVASRPDKASRQFNFFRPSMGVVEDQWLEPVGLVRLQSGTISLAEQNMFAFLLSEPAQVALAEGYEAIPLVKSAMTQFAQQAQGTTSAREIYLSNLSLFGVDGSPLVPLDSARDLVAQAMRMVLRDAVGGMPMRQATSKAEAWYQEQLKAAGS
jgi:hypothetical protein